MWIKKTLIIQHTTIINRVTIIFRVTEKMNYTIDKKKSGPGRLVLMRSRKAQIVLSVLLLIPGLPFLLAGLIMMLDPGRIAFFWAGTGLLFCSFSVILVTQITLPENLIFDNLTGQMKIRESRAGEDEYIAFPYEEISNINKRLHRSGDTSYHVVELEKKDGSFWTLYQSSSEKKSESVLAEIMKYVNRETSGNAPDPGQFSSIFSIKRDGAGSSVSWTMKKSLSNNILGVFVIGSFVMILYGMESFVESETAYTLAIVFITAVASLFIFFSFYNAGRIHTVTVTEKLLRFSSTGIFSKNRGFNMPLSVIDAVLFNFSINLPENSLFIMKKNETELFQRVKRGKIDLVDIKSAILLLLNIKKINTGALTIREKIQLESIIQELIKEKSGIKGL